MARRLQIRHALLVFVGMGITFILLSFKPLVTPPSPVIHTYESRDGTQAVLAALHEECTSSIVTASPETSTLTVTATQTLWGTMGNPTPLSRPTEQASFPSSPSNRFSETTVDHHAPGWTLFSNLYMSNDTLYIVTRKPKTEFPELRMIVSTPLWALNEENNIRDREPVEGVTLGWITPEEAELRWGKGIIQLHGNTVLVNEPAQFLNHYYHAIAELLLGLWVFWTGVHDTYTPPPIHRMIFARAPALPEPIPYGDGWHDRPGFNAFILRGIFPDMNLQDKNAWNDLTNTVAGTGTGRVVRFPKVVLTDRSASFRGQHCGSENQRIASEALEYIRKLGRLGLGGGDPSSGGLVSNGDGKWWQGIRESMWNYVGAVTPQHHLSTSGTVGHGTNGRIRITYISRQRSRSRKLRSADHIQLVQELENLVKRRDWELKVLDAEFLTKDQQIQMMAQTDILLGVHGNGLSHLLFIPKSEISTVLEMFYPGGFAHDYHWPSWALGHGYAAVWKDRYWTNSNQPGVSYPEGFNGDGGFQGNNIPIDGAFVARLIEKRVDGEVDLN